MSIRCVTFDWGDTLATNRGNPYIASLKRAFAGLAHDIDALGHSIPDGWERVILQAVCDEWTASGDVDRHPDHRELDALVPIRACLGRIGDFAEADLENGLLAPAVDRFFATFMQVLLPFPGVHDCLKALHSRGLRIGILSHSVWPERYCRAWFASNKLDQHIDFYSMSSSVGWIKPHAAHYEDALGKAGCAAEELLHVGDHPERDISGAKAFGFHTCLRVTEGYYDDDLLRDCPADLRVLNVKEVPAHVANLVWDD